MTHITHRLLALALTIAIIPQALPLYALSDETASSSATSSESTFETSTSSSASESESAQESAEQSSAASTSEESASSSEHDDLEIHATSSEPIDQVVEEVNETIASSTAGFSEPQGESAATSTDTAIDTATSTGTSASSSPGETGSTPTATSTEPLATSTPAVDPASAAPTASSTQTIITGNAVAVANILNILNTSFLNSAGAILFANFIEQAGLIDLRNGELFGACGEAGCSGLQGVQLNLLQDAYILNNIFLSANSGDNEIGNATSTDAAILTGDAFAGLNLINLANVTFADSQYLLATLNAFNGVEGDIVFPSLFSFFSALQSAIDPDSIAINNTATVNNDVAATALSGDNTTSDVDGTTLIQTGNALAHTNIYNQINSLLAGEGVAVMLRITGDFNGEIWGLPANVEVFRDGSNILIRGKGTGEAQSIDGFGLNATSTAGIDNTVGVSARTGSNDVDTVTGGALISTGNAFAGANIINIANQTVIGRNWMLAIFNIFGDLNGNIAFGRPDLWVGARVAASGVVQDGATLTYTITVKNRGDSPINQATLRERPDIAHLEIMSASHEYEAEGDALRFDLGSLAPGEEREVTYEARVHDTPQGTAITSLSEVSGHETDNDLADNTDSTTIHAASQSSGGGGNPWPPPFIPSTGSIEHNAQGSAGNERAAITVERVGRHLSATPAAPRVTQTLVVKNTSTQAARDVILSDLLRDPSGTALHREEWVFDAIAAGEELLITYEFTFAPAAPLGEYSVSMSISGANIDGGESARGTIEYRASEPSYTIAVPEAMLPPSMPVAAVAPVRARAVSETPVVEFEVQREEEAAGEPLVAAAAAADSRAMELYIASGVGVLLFALLFRGLRKRYE